MTQNCCAMCTFPSLQDVIDIQFEQMKRLQTSFTVDNTLSFLTIEFINVHEKYIYIY
jgi:hypothetical protein